MADNGFDITGYIQAAGIQKKLVDTTTQALQNIATQSADYTDQIVGLITGGTDERGETALSLETKKLGELEAQERKSQFYANLGNGEGYGKIASRLSDAYLEAINQSLELTDSLKQRKSVGLLDNPLSYIWNQLIIPDEEQALQGTEARAKVASDALQKVNTLASGVGAVEEQFKQVTSAAAVDSQVQGLQKGLEAKAIRAKLDAARLNAHDLVTVMNANGQQLQNIASVINMRNQQEYLAMSQESHAQAAVRFKEWESEVKAKKEYEQEWLENINRGAEQAGLPPVESAKVLAILRSGQQLPQQLQKLAEIGYINKETGMQGNIGRTPAAVMDTATKLNLQVPDAVGTLYVEAQKKLTAEASLPGSNLGKDAAAREIRFNQIVADLAKEQQRSINPNDKDNPFGVPSVKVMAEQSPLFKSSKLYTQVLAPQVANGFDTSDPNKLVNIGMQAVKEGKINLAEFVVDLTNYYEQGRAATVTKNQFSKYAIPVEPGYNVKFKALSGLINEADSWNPFSSHTTITLDMTNRVKVAEYLLKLHRAETGPMFGSVFNGDEGYSYGK